MQDTWFKVEYTNEAARYRMKQAETLEIMSVEERNGALGCTAAVRVDATPASYAKLRPAQVWQKIEEAAASKTVLHPTVPLRLKSGSDPYLIDYLSPSKAKSEMFEAATLQMAAYMRLLGRMDHYGPPTHTPYDCNDKVQYPPKPKPPSALDTCGYQINYKHHLFQRWLSQLPRSLTPDGCKDSWRYARREPPINGGWFQYEFVGKTFSQPKAKIPMHGQYRYYEVAFLAYCVSWELKGRPYTPDETHDRLDNNQGYMFHNTMSRTSELQAMNRSTVYSRIRYRKDIQDGFKRKRKRQVQNDTFNTSRSQKRTQVQQPTSDKSQRKKRIRTAQTNARDHRPAIAKKARRANKSKR